MNKRNQEPVWKFLIKFINPNLDNNDKFKPVAYNENKIGEVSIANYETCVRLTKCYKISVAFE